MLSSAIQISNFILSSDEELRALADSLQAEFEHFAALNYQDHGLLKAKKRQIERLNSLIKSYSKINDLVLALYESKQKAEYCLIAHGITYCEYFMFTSRPYLELMELLMEQKREGIVEVPIIYKKFVGADFTYQLKSAKRTDKPTLPKSVLADMALRFSQKREPFSNRL